MFKSDISALTGGPPCKFRIFKSPKYYGYMMKMIMVNMMMVKMMMMVIPIYYGFSDWVDLF